MVSFDKTNNRIRILNDANNDGIVSSGETVRWRVLEENCVFAVPPKSIAGQTIATPFNGSNLKTSADGYPSITYRRDGAASSSLEVYLRSYSSDPNDFRVLVVTQATGRVEVMRYGNNQWRKAR